MNSSSHEPLRPHVEAKPLTTADVKIDSSDATQLTLKLELGMSQLTRRESLSASEMQFVKTMSRTGAGLMLNLLGNGLNPNLPMAVDMAHKTTVLHDADGKISPSLPVMPVEKRIAGSTNDLVYALQAHAGIVDRFEGDFFAANRVHIEDTAIAISGMLGLMADANQGLALNQFGQESLQFLLESYDQAFPAVAGR